MPTDEHEAVGEFFLSSLRQVYDFRNVRQVIAGKGYYLRLPVIDGLEVILVGLCLKIDELHLMTGIPNGLGH